MLFNRELIYAGTSAYGKYKIIDTRYNGRPARVLYGEKGSPQSGAALDENPELLFDYNQRFLELIMSHQPKKLLVIGGGAFMLPIAAFHRFPDLSIDVVEIDPLLVKLACDYFNLPDSKRLKVYIDDGAAFVRKARTAYDMIIIDAFSGYTIPHHLLTQESLHAYRSHLKKDGLIAINFISEYKLARRRLAHELLASFGDVFSWRALYQADIHYPTGEEQNLLLVAGSTPRHFPYLQSTEVELFD